MNKRIFYTELSYLLGLIILALGTALMEAADLGLSMVVAPAYLFHLRLSETLPFFSFGTAEYCLQAVLLLIMMLILRRFRFFYLFSFITAVFYGLMLDGAIGLMSLFTVQTMLARLLCYLLGMLICALSISMLFHTYIAPEAYELFVKELSAHFKIDIHRFKTGYDCVSCIISVILSFIFFGLWHFEGIKLGTIFCALINGRLIGFFSKKMEQRYDFKDALPLRKYFN